MFKYVINSEYTNFKVMETRDRQVLEKHKWKRILGG